MILQIFGVLSKFAPDRRKPESPFPLSFKYIWPKLPSQALGV